MTDPSGMWGEKPNRYEKVVVDPDDNIIYHDDGPDKNIYRSPDGKKGADGNTDGLEVVGRENPNNDYRLGHKVKFINGYVDGIGFVNMNFVVHPSQALESSWVDDALEIIFTAGGMVLIKSGGKWFFRKFTKELAEELAELSAKSVDDKLARYLLNFDHAVGKSKAKWFKEALGFTIDNASDLAKQIVFDPNTAIKTGVTKHGVKYNQVINILGANGKKINVNFGWIRNNDGAVRLVTAIPTKK